MTEIKGTGSDENSDVEFSLDNSGYVQWRKISCIITEDLPIKTTAYSLWGQTGIYFRVCCCCFTSMVTYIRIIKHLI